MKKKLLILKGYAEAEDELIKIKRNNFVVLPGGKKEGQEKSTQTEGVDTMKKNCSRRKDGRWQYSKQQDGYLYYAIAKTYRELLEKIKNIKPRKVKTLKKQNLKTLTVSEYFYNFYENYIKNDLKDKTKNDWLRSIEEIKKSFSRVPIKNLTTEDVQSFINSIDKERKREILYQRFIRVLQKAFITGKIKNDITLGLEKPARKNIKERPPLNLQEQKALLGKAKGTSIYPFIMFSIIIGSRREETLRFNFENDVDEKNNLIYINETKMKTTRRRVQTTPDFINFLKEYLPAGRFDFELSYPTKKIGELMRELKINNCLHGLRHTCSANLYFLGAKDKFRQLQLGHASIVTTNDIYTNIYENIKKSDLLEFYGGLYPKFD